MPGPSRDLQELTPALEAVLAEARQYFEAIDELPAREETAFEAARRFGGALPEDGDGAAKVIADLIADGRDAHIRSQGPRFFNWVVGGTTPAALAADWYASTIDQLAGSWTTSPLATRLEQLSIQWLLDLFRLPTEWGGVLTTGATMANFTALGAARRWWGEQHGVDVDLQGLSGLPAVPVVSSGFIHPSAIKALGMLGIGRDRVTICAADETGRADLEAMRHALRETGGAPAIVIANAGEVSAGQFDPIEEIADLLDPYPAWLHVDGAFGLFARVSPRVAGLADDVERANSVISDGHKWLNVPYDCGFAFVRDATALAESFAIGAAYLPRHDEELSYAMQGPEMSRRARSLAVWASLRAYGRSGYREIVERNLDNAAALGRKVEEADDLELLAPVVLNVVCFRYRPPGVAEEELDDLNTRIAAEILEDGRIYMGPTRWAGKAGFRPAFVNWRTTDADAELAAEVVREIGARLAPSAARA